MTGWIVDKYGPSDPRWAQLAWTAVALIWLCWLITRPGVLNAFNPRRGKVRMFSLLLVFVACGGICTGVFWFTARPSDLVQPHDDGSDAISPTQVVSLYRLFKEDVPGIKSIDFAPVSIHVQSSGAALGVEPRLHADFVGLSKFVSFYIPSSPVAKDIIRFIADNYSVLTGIDMIELILTKPGEYPRSTEAMKFTGSIVIYYKDTLSNADLASLEDYYSTRQLTPVWRSTGYVQTQILLRKSREALQQLSKVPSAMQPPKDQLLAVTGITAGVDGEQIQIRNKGPRATQ